MPFCRSLRSARALGILCFAIACGPTDGESAEAALSPEPSGHSETTTAPTPPEAECADNAPGANPAPPPGGKGADPVPLPYRGVNVAGAEFGTKLPGVEGTDYAWPTNEGVDYFLSKGMNTFRIGFKWERLQSKAYGELEARYLEKLDRFVSHATSRGARVILNPHNFARYYGETIGSAKVPSAAFADFWRRLARHYANNARVMFNLVNEPHDMPTEQWVGAANGAIAAIRKAGAANLVHVPGNSWTGAHSWSKSYYGTSNAVAMLDIVDPLDNVVFEVHQYLDSDSSGSSDDCVSTTIGSERLADFIAWLRAHNKKGFVGEFAGAKNATCNLAVEDMLRTMMSASDVLLGWQWWAAGPMWGNYRFSIEPKDGKDQPHMTLLLPHLFGSSAL